MYTTPRIALAMFIMAFVGVVRGLWGSIMDFFGAGQMGSYANGVGRI